MELDFTTGFTQPEVEAILAENKKLLSRLTTQFTESGSSMTYRRLADVKEVIAAAQAALRVMDPATYGVPTNRVKQSSVEPIGS